MLSHLCKFTLHAVQSVLAIQENKVSMEEDNKEWLIELHYNYYSSYLHFCVNHITFPS